MSTSERDFRQPAIAAAEAAGVPRALARASYDAFEQALFEELLTSGAVRIPNLFRLRVRVIHPRVHNPASGLSIGTRPVVRLWAKLRGKLKKALYQVVVEENLTDD